MPSSLRVVSIIDDVLSKTWPHKGVLLRIFALLMAPALFFALLIFYLRPSNAPLSPFEFTALVSWPLEESVVSWLILMAPPLGFMAITHVFLGGAAAALGWQILYGRGPTVRGGLSHLYARRWRLLFFFALKAAIYGVGLVLFLGGVAAYVQPPEGLILRGVFWAVSLTLSFFLSLSIPALVVEDLTPGRAVIRSISFCLRHPLVVGATWVLVQVLAVVVVWNLEVLFTNQAMMDLWLLPWVVDVFEPKDLLLFWVFRLFPQPLVMLIMVALYRRLRQDSEALDLELALRALPEQG